MLLPVMGGASEVPGGMKRPASQGRARVMAQAAPRPPSSYWKAVLQLTGRWPDKSQEWADKVASDRPLTTRLNAHMG